MSERGAPAPSPQSPEPFDYAAQWLDEPEAVELELPSGKVVTVRRPDLFDFIRLEGSRIPDALVPLINRFIGERDGKDGDDSQLSAADKMKRRAEDTLYLDVYVVAAVVEPRLALGEPGPGEVSVRRLDRADRNRIWDWIEGAATPILAGFPEQPGEADGTIPAVGDGAGVSPAPESPAAPHEAG